MNGLLLLLVQASFLVMGLTALVKGEIALTNSRKITRTASQVVGVVFLVGVVASFLNPFNGLYVLLFCLAVAIGVGLLSSEKMEAKKAEA